ncbi:hypothetical protein AMJ50_02395 [Parcubacteria bacterium DG_74_3]|nr:MAG: hypothetical protein AMJ50_02395 [Parcubacteria bacterium DG_74_3]
MNKNCSQKKAFTLVEMLIIIAIIGILSSIILVSISGAREKGRDAKRKAEIAQFGRFLTLSCYLPKDGEGEYDLVPLTEEIKNENPQYSQYFSNIPKDPKTGTESESKYIYTVNADGSKCALYANLENEKETVTLLITVPTPGGGVGVLKTDTQGWNGTPLYFQYSN